MAAKLRQDKRRARLLCTGAAAIAGGLLLGRADIIVDCLLVFSACLSAAVLVVAFSAKSVKEIRGFGTLAVAGTAAGLAMCTAAGKLILTEGTAGRIVELLAGGFVKGNLIYSALIFFALGAVILLLVVRSLISIRREAGDFVKSECSDEYASFFTGMKRGASFMMFAAIAEACVIVSVTAGGLVAGSWGGFGMSAGDGVALAVATGTMTLTMGAGCVLGSRYLVSRARKSAEWEGRGDMVEWEPMMKTVASEVVCEEENAAMRIEEAALEIDGVEAEEAQWYDGGGEVEESCGPRFWNGAEMRDKGTCERIVERIIGGARESSRFILLAAAERKELGVTAAVNIAMCLAQKERKCLLVDMDTDRDAVSRVFDADTNEVKAVKTCIGNLWVQRGNQGNVSLTDGYDHIILYSPDRRCAPNIDDIEPDAMTGMLFGFGDVSDEMAGLREKIVMRGSNVFEPEFMTTA